MKQAELVQRVKKVLVEELNLDITPDAIAEDDLVYAPHIRLDSLGYLRLMHGIEQEFHFEIKPEEVGHILFERIGDIVDFVADRTPG